LLDYARGVAEYFNLLPSTAVQQTKSLLRRWDSKIVAEVVDVERLQLIKQLDDPEAKEALSAFLEKRKPVFNRK
jgi:enoyl-CoA hydratase/carnithine racemase